MTDQASPGASTARINGVTVRFHPPPSGELGEFPWVVYTDVLAVAQFTPEQMPYWSGRWRRTYPSLFRELPDGMMIVPDIAALGLFECCRQLGWERAAEHLLAFENACANYFLELHSGISDTQLQSLIQQATLHAMLFVPGVTHAN